MGITDILQQKFDHTNFKALAKESFNHTEASKQMMASALYSSEIKNTEFIGHTSIQTNTEDAGQLALFIVETANNPKNYRGRDIQREHIGELLNSLGKEYKDALAAFYCKDKADWRISYIYADDTVNRLSYLVGPRYNSSASLFSTKLLGLKKITSAFNTLSREDLTDCFNKVALNKGFYLEFEKLTTKMTREIKNIMTFKIYGDYNYKMDEPTTETLNKNCDAVAQELMRKVIASQFIQSMGCLGVKNNDTLGSGDLNFFNTLWVNYSTERKYNKFFDEYMSPLLFKYLADKSYKGMYNNKFGKIPYLNGGLFINPDEVKSIGLDVKSIRYVLATEGTDFSDTLWFNETLGNRGIINVFADYQLITFEDEEHDKVIGVDPEMIGNIFECALDPEKRKSTGTVYTPKYVVDQMSHAAVVQMLVNKTLLSADKVNTLFEVTSKVYNAEEAMELLNRLGTELFINLPQIDEALKTCTVIEPTVGSGAFAVGVLQEIVRLRRNLTPLLEKRYADNTEKLDKFKLEDRTPYKLKLNTIKNSIYAVDIQSNAVEITKLRLWLSLLADEDLSKSELELLPNLDINIRQGNSLVSLLDISRLTAGKSKLTEQDKWALEELVKPIENELIDMYYVIYSEENRKDMIELLAEALKIKLNIAKETLEVYGLASSTCKKIMQAIKKGEEKNSPRDYFNWEIDIPHIMLRGGFDICIGNPPYVKAALFKDLKATLQAIYPDVANGTADLYVYFYNLAFNLVKKNTGIVSFITSNKWLRAGYGKELRQWLINNVTVTDLIDFGGRKIFEQAGVDVNILIATKKPGATEWNYTDGSKF